jgi:hypothetical protein
MNKNYTTNKFARLSSNPRVNNSDRMTVLEGLSKSGLNITNMGDGKNYGDTTVIYDGVKMTANDARDLAKKNGVAKLWYLPRDKWIDGLPTIVSLPN